jgi:PAS domain S-box-containing protein
MKEFSEQRVNGKAREARARQGEASRNGARARQGEASRNGARTRQGEASQARLERVPERTSLVLPDTPPLQRARFDEREDIVNALRRYEELYDWAPVSFISLDRCATILGVNKAAGKLLASTPEWLRGRPFLVFISREHISTFLGVLTKLRRVPDGRETVEIDLSIGGLRIPAQVSVQASVVDGAIVYRMAIVDLSEAKLAETELKQALSNWYSLVESAPDVIMTVDRKGIIKFVNRDAWGYSKQQLIGASLVEIVSDKDAKQLGKCIAAAFVLLHPTTCELAVPRGAKGHCYSFSFGSVRRAATATATATVTIRDVTQHKDAEEALRASREQLREFAARLDEVREEERTRVAREIHDELGQALTILKLDLAWLQSKAKAEQTIRKKIKSMIHDVDQTIDSVRKIVSELRPSILDDMGLAAALEWQVSEFRKRTGIDAVFESSSEDFNLPRDTAAALFRVVQEALTNVMRHADARAVRVALKPRGGILRIVITDDGRGVAAGKVNDRKSFGLIGMRERVHRIGGEFNIFSGPGRGTRLEIVAPLHD